MEQPAQKNAAYESAIHPRADPDAKAIRRITLVGALVNVLLSALKIIAGLIGQSSALVSDGVHSFSDLLTDAFVLTGARISEQPPDDKHPYGHGKFDNLASILIASVLILVGGGLAYSAIIKETHAGESIASSLVIIIAAFSIISKEILYQATQRTAKRLNASSLSANAWHHRSDALSSVIVLISGILTAFGHPGYDRVASIIVGAMVAFVGISLIADNLKMLVEVSAGNDVVDTIRAIVIGVDGANDCHKIRTRFVGRRLFVDIHVEVDPELSVRDGHRIATAVETAVHSGLSYSTNVLVHIEPYEPVESPTEISAKTPDGTTNGD